MRSRLARTTIVTMVLAITPGSTVPSSITRWGRSAWPNPALTGADAPARARSDRTATENPVNTGAKLS